MTRLLKCPKCGSGSMSLGEMILIVETRYVEDDVMSAVLDVEPVTTKGYTAYCRACRHEWRPRSATIDAVRSKEGAV